MTGSQKSETGNIAKHPTETPPASLDGLVGRYCHETVLRPASQVDYANAVRIFQRDTGVADMRAVSRDTVIQWRDAIIRRASLTTWNTYRRQMKTLFNFAMKNGWLEGNPFTEVKPLAFLKRKKTVSKRVLNEAILSLSGDSTPIKPGWFWAAAFKLLYYTGMRRRQLTSLRWRDIDFDRKTILLSIEGSKSKREWEIPIPAQCEEELRELHRASKQRRTHLENCQVFWIQLFVSGYAGQEMTPRQVSAAFKRLSDHTGVTVSPHRLRHTMATALATGKNPDLKSLQYLLGHSNLATTLEYVSPEMSQLRVQMPKLNLDSLEEID